MKRNTRRLMWVGGVGLLAWFAFRWERQQSVRKYLRSESRAVDAEPAPGGAVAQPPPGELTIASVPGPEGSAAELTGVDPGYKQRTRLWMS